MATVTARNLSHAFRILEEVFEGLEDWTDFFEDYFEPYLDAAQDDYWQDAVDKGLGASTVTARRNRWGYYEEAPNQVPGDPSAAVDRPAWVWTGWTRDSTKQLTDVTDDEATVDTEANYVGPIPHPDPVELALDYAGIPDAWDEDALDRAVDNVLIEQWLEERILQV